MIKLKSLHVKGYKNLADTEIDFTKSEKYCAFIGLNASGKSNILEAISIIFALVYDKKYNNSEKFEKLYIEYIFHTSNISIEIINNSSEINIILKKDEIIITLEEGLPYLPSKIILNYSGEERRLWEKVYNSFYVNYEEEIKKNNLLKVQMNFIDKNCWDIALICLLCIDDEYTKNLLDINNIRYVQVNFEFNITKYSTYNSNKLVEFLDEINPNKNSKEIVELINIQNSAILSEIDSDVKKRYQTLYNFLYLVSAFNSEKIIKSLEVNFNYITTKQLSEGQKKLILVRFITHLLADENSLLLFDEPDSHIHVSKKEKLAELINESPAYSLITTHSPSLTLSFEDKNIAILNNGKIEDKQKQDIFSHITDGIWNYHEQSVFLSSPHNIDLIVEGKFDKIHIETAIKSDNLGADFPDLKFGVFDLKSCDNMKKIFDGLCNADNLHIPNKKIIFIFDNEKQFFNGQNFSPKEFQGAQKIKDNLYKKKGIYLLFLPKKTDFKENFTIENMYPSEKFANCLQETLTRRLSDGDYFNNFIDFITDGIKEDAKKLLSEKCLGYEKGDFAHFEELFKLIKDVKDDSNN